jgi:hypothetical protein
VLTLFDAETTKVYALVEAVVGRPDKTPEVEFSANPGGSAPEVTEKVGAGVPVAA